MKKLLFVCLGNICRSPAAEGIMQSLVAEAGLKDQIFCDSAGTSAHHVGEPADQRMRAHATKRGYRLGSLARQFRTQDLELFDWVITMDDSNRTNVLSLALHKTHAGKVHRLVDFCQKHKVSEVPDPYYGGAQGFETVLDILEDGCAELLSLIKKEL